MKEVDEIADKIIERIRERGFVCSKDFSFGKNVDWYWSSANLARAALETLYFRGRLIIHHKKGTLKFYSLAEDYIPPGILNAADPNETIEEYHDWAVHRRVRAVGLLNGKASDAFPGILDFKKAERIRSFERLEKAGKIIRIKIEGLDCDFFFSAMDSQTLEAAQREHEPRTELIAPLDSFVWDRKLTKALFGFRCRWEIYNRPNEREYGYYALPLLHGERLIGRAELINDKKTKSLLVKTSGSSRA